MAAEESSKSRCLFWLRRQKRVNSERDSTVNSRERGRGRAAVFSPEMMVAVLRLAGGLLEVAAF